MPVENHFNGASGLQGEEGAVAAGQGGIFFLAAERAAGDGLFDADFLIPVLTIQPVVENAIIHGIKPKVGGGVVRVSLRHGEGCYEVRVEDDGVGYMPGDEKTDRSVGIQNIRTRMNQYPGCSFTIESEPGRGTSVLLVYADNLGDA